MEFKLTFSLTTLALLLTVFLSQSSTASASFRLCGFKLTTTLQHLCKHKTCGGYQLHTRKRSIASFLDEISAEAAALVDERPAEEVDEHPLRPLLADLRIRKRSGIATECCEKRCNLAYLRTYCCAGFEA
ncbi:unnamed protein product [Bursaphelenchus xylophilus]|uniref:(pine wood nematode) hypothetical protein n=1 Tax=Bursaphelenchus xylophilus TaxID=6326 RepID=A0A1I7RM45_BURXY|nr:unnamed protein product [Bursaphelenchus xylophilus]CAG9118191.1 unnamed protein product [Bursaphelenchus xylophilus]